MFLCSYEYNSRTFILIVYDVIYNTKLITWIKFTKTTQKFEIESLIIFVVCSNCVVAKVSAAELRIAVHPLSTPLSRFLYNSYFLLTVTWLAIIKISFNRHHMEPRFPRRLIAPTSERSMPTEFGIRGKIKRLHDRKLFPKFIASEYLLQT